MQDKKNIETVTKGNKSLPILNFTILKQRFLYSQSKNFLTTYPFKTFDKIFILLFITSCITIFACRERVTPPDTPQYIPPIVLSLEDVSCTDAFLRVRFVDTTIERSFILKRDGATVASVANSPLDTMLIDENLLPKRIYRYKAYRVKGGASVDSSMELTIETMDTTSHEFSWQIDTLGDGYSVLRDVAIINDTLAYAVGEIYKRDSVGNWDPLPYNLVKWNGERWELLKVTVQTRWGAVTAPIRGIFAFSAHDIWLVSGDAIHRDGRTWTNYDVRLLTGNDMVSVDKAWGSNSSNMYFVGWNGTIIHYDGARWRRLESGTDQYIQDIFGIVNQKTGFKTIFCVASHPLGYGDKKILSINVNNTVDTVQWPWQRVVMSVWFKKFDKIYTCGGGIFRRGADRQWKEIAGANIIPTLTRRIRGVDDNDFFTVGGYGVVVHYNGASFRVYSEVPKYLYTSVDVKENIVVVVGYSGIVLIGIRNQ